MKTRAIFFLAAVMALNSCANAGNRQYETTGSDPNSVTVSEFADEEPGIIVPDIEVEHDTAFIIQFLFDYPTNCLKISPDGKPVIFTVDSLGLENPKGVKHVEKSVAFYIRLKKGDKYYDPKTDSGKIAEDDTEILSEESWPYSETYEFDRKGRLIKYEYSDEDIVTFEYRPDGSFTYTAEHKETDDFYSRKIYGKWDGSVWQEEIFHWDESKRQFKPGVSYTLKKQIVHPGFFTVEPEKRGKTGAILFRCHDGWIIRHLTPGERIPSDLVNRSAKNNNKVTREDKDSHGNFLKVKEYDSHNSAPETKYKITYW